MFYQYNKRLHNCCTVYDLNLTLRPLEQKTATTLSGIYFKEDELVVVLQYVFRFALYS